MQRRLRLQWPLTATLVVIVGGLVVVAAGRFRSGAVVMALGVSLAFFLRLLLPHSRAGMLAVRSKGIDIAVLATLAVVMGVLALWVPPPSG